MIPKKNGTTWGALISGSHITLGMPSTPTFHNFEKRTALKCSCDTKAKWHDLRRTRYETTSARTNPLHRCGSKCTGPDPWGYNPPTTNAAHFFLTFISSGVLGGALMPKQNKTEWYYLVSTHFGTIAAHTNPSLTNLQIHISYRPIHGSLSLTQYESQYESQVLWSAQPHLCSPRGLAIPVPYKQYLLICVIGAHINVTAR